MTLPAATADSRGRADRRLKRTRPCQMFGRHAGSTLRGPDSTSGEGLSTCRWPTGSFSPPWRTGSQGPT